MNYGFCTNRRSFLAWAAAAAMAPAATSGARENRIRPVVVELFTSEGCSSCPPADAFMAELIKQQPLIGLTLHVDYWDYLGWRDTLALPEATRRQRDYAARRGDGRVYTPQIIVNGVRHAVGSRQDEILAMIETERKRLDHFIDMSIGGGGEELIIDIAAAPSELVARNGNVWVMSVAPKLDVEVTRGENAGRTMTYANVVRQIIPAGMWHGEARKVTLPRGEVLPDPSLCCAAMLQADDAGPVLGAAWLAASAPS